MTGWPEPVVTSRAWARLTRHPPPGQPPDAAAAESWYGPVAVARAWRDPAPGRLQRCTVTLTSYPGADQAASVLRACGVGVVLAGKTLTHERAFHALQLLPVGARTTDTVQALRRLLADGALQHDGGQFLASQILALRVITGGGRLRIVQHGGRADAIKAAVWACQAALAEPPAIY